MFPSTAFIASGDIAIPTFLHLIHSSSKPAVLITQPDKPIGRSQSKTVESPIKKIATEHSIPVWQPLKIKEIAEDLADLKIQYAIVMAYGQIIGKAVRAAPLEGIVNLHASLLPKYRGASCIQAAIANGDTKTGITVMRVIRELDAGAIISKSEITILPHETADHLHDRLANLGPTALEKAFQILSKDPQAGTPQEEKDVTYAPKLSREDGRLDLGLSSLITQRKIEAYHTWPGTFTEIEIQGKAKRLKIFPPIEIATQSIPHNKLKYIEGKLYLGCGSESLALSQVQLDGSKRMDASAFANRL